VAARSLISLNTWKGGKKKKGEEKGRASSSSLISHPAAGVIEI